MKNIIVSTITKYTILILSTALYTLLLSWGFEIIDPCSGTPSYNLTWGFVLLALYPIFSGTLAYVLFVYDDKFSFNQCSAAVFIAVLWLLLSLGTLACWSFIEQPFAELLKDSNSFSYFFNYDGCYGELETNSWLMHLLYICCLLLWGRIIYWLKKRL